jgi:16S rRNA (cytosine967-C5)-methyltransferase
MHDTKQQVPLWQQLQGASALLMAVRSGRSLTTELDKLSPALRPGVQALSFHVLRWLGRAEALRQQLVRRAPPPEVDALLCVALALACNDAAAEPSSESVDSPALYAGHTLVDQAVEAAKRGENTRHQASFINGCLRRFLREAPAMHAACAGRPQAVWNHPQWWIDRLRKDHPDYWQAILRANNSHAPLALRVNLRKTTQARYLAALQAAGVAARAAGPQGVLLESARPVPGLPGFAEGEFSVQDTAAQLAAPLLLEGLAPLPGRRLRLLDACAAPGGKTAHLLELADAEVTALDIDARRCDRIRQNLAREGLEAEIKVADAGDPDTWWDGRPYDGILLDAPCTASGIVRRHPDVRWLRRPTDIGQLAALQAQCRQRAPLFAPEAERRALLAVLNECR